MDNTVFYDVFHRVYWDWRIAADIYFGGISVGAFLFSIFISTYYKDKYKNTAKIAAYIAPISIIIGFLFLFMELGKPFRMFRFFTGGLNLMSPLSWKAWAQFFYFPLALMHAFFYYKDNDKLRKMIGYIGVPFALIIGSFDGYLFSNVEGKVLWTQGPTTMITVISVIITGLAAVTLVLNLKENTRGLYASIKKSSSTILNLAIISEILLFLLWMLTLNHGNSIHAVGAFNSSFGLVFWGGVMVLGLIIPLLLGIFTHYKEKNGEEQSSSILIVSSILLLIGGFLFRYTFVIGGQLFS